MILTFLYALGGEGHIAFQQIIIGRVNVEKHLVNLGIDLHSLTALAIQSARTGIPQIRSTRRFTGELRHRILALTSEQVRAVDGKGEIDPIPFPYHPAISSNLISTERNEQIQTLSSYN